MSLAIEDRLDTVLAASRWLHPLLGRDIVIAVIGGMGFGIAAAFALAAIENAVPAIPAEVTESAPQPIRLSPADLSAPMHFTLDADGILYARGSIEPGTSASLARKLQEDAGAIRKVSLNSPGGSLDEAMAMARHLRTSGIGTEVADGAVCASSCPLLFAGGIERHAGSRAAIGVHQFYAGPTSGLRATQAMADAQITTARISRHLAEMGVDPAAWLHALDTPPTTLYYFSTWELAQYRLTTGDASVPSPGVLGGLAHAFGRDLHAISSRLFGAIEGGIGAAQQFLVNFARSPFGDTEARRQPAA